MSELERALAVAPRLEFVNTMGCTVVISEDRSSVTIGHSRGEESFLELASDQGVMLRWGFASEWIPHLCPALRIASIVSDELESVEDPFDVLAGMAMRDFADVQRAWVDALTKVDGTVA